MVWEKVKVVGGREVQEGGDVCTRMADSLHRAAETNTSCSFLKTTGTKMTATAANNLTSVSPAGF